MFTFLIFFTKKSSYDPSFGLRPAPQNANNKLIIIIITQIPYPRQKIYTLFRTATPSFPWPPPLAALLLPGFPRLPSASPLAALLLPGFPSPSCVTLRRAVKPDVRVLFPLSSRNPTLAGSSLRMARTTRTNRTRVAGLRGAKLRPARPFQGRKTRREIDGGNETLTSVPNGTSSG